MWVEIVVAVGCEFHLCVAAVCVDLQTVADLRRRTTPRVMMSGCVDLMHSGHVACFAEAAQYVVEVGLGLWDSAARQRVGGSFDDDMVIVCIFACM